MLRPRKDLVRMCYGWTLPWFVIKSDVVHSKCEYKTNLYAENLSHFFIRPSVAHSYKHLVLSERSPRDFWTYLLTLHTHAPSVIKYTNYLNLYLSVSDSDQCHTCHPNKLTNHSSQSTLQDRRALHRAREPLFNIWLKIRVVLSVINKYSWRNINHVTYILEEYAGLHI
jgi:hypothetical protein